MQTPLLVQVVKMLFLFPLVHPLDLNLIINAKLKKLSAFLNKLF
jgi:hypothetical protein